MNSKKGLGRERCRDHDDERSLADAGDRRDVAYEIETKVRVERRVDRVGRNWHQDCVPVGRSAHDIFGSYITTEAGLVFDHELLA
jgi:hypothetical protein